MKFHGKLLALCLLQGAGAFTIQRPTLKSRTRVASNTGSSAEMLGDFSEPEQAYVEGMSNLPYSAPPGGALSSPRAFTDVSVDEIMSTLSAVKVQGSSLRTWSIMNHSVNRVQIFLKTEGRPLNAAVDLWQGPDNTPQKVQVYIEDGAKRPFSAVFECPGGGNTVSIRNENSMEFPLSACVDANLADGLSLIPAGATLPDMETSRLVQGGAVFTAPFDSSVASVSVLLKTDGRPLNCRLELLQGPNNNKQVMEVYSEDGLLRPFYAVMETPGSGNVVRVCNTAPVEFPLTASVRPFKTLIHEDFNNESVFVVSSDKYGDRNRGLQAS
jgi:hypothetical protein